ncbi:MAG: helix-turn-helix domain-containing protein [Pseudoalteromonas distincta]|uniref:helix-turn-helix domain-containing protein n=1 Tax=Pseudoalteromonas sp. SK20 TaxID=1938367 RepID=UPI000977EAA1|nr:helix-turn-helix domain-containing protein [Pseudoalteromonas sp. SK20]
MSINKRTRILGRRIKTLREKQLLSKEVVASKLNISLDEYEQWEQGDIRPTYRDLVKLTYILRSHRKELLAGLELERARI